MTIINIDEQLAQLTEAKEELEKVLRLSTSALNS